MKKVKLTKSAEKRRVREGIKRRVRGESEGGPLRASEFLSTLPRRERRKALLEPTPCPCVWFCPSTDLFYLFHGKGGGEVFSRSTYGAVMREVGRITGAWVPTRADRPPGPNKARQIKALLRPDLAPQDGGQVIEDVEVIFGSDTP